MREASLKDSCGFYGRKLLCRCTVGPPQPLTVYTLTGCAGCLQAYNCLDLWIHIHLGWSRYVFITCGTLIWWAYVLLVSWINLQVKLLCKLYNRCRYITQLFVRQTHCRCKTMRLLPKMNRFYKYVVHFGQFIFSYNLLTVVGNAMKTLIGYINKKKFRNVKLNLDQI